MVNTLTNSTMNDVILGTVEIHHDRIYDTRYKIFDCLIISQAPSVN